MRNLWEQRLDEPEECYQLFRWWLEQKPRSAPSDPNLALQYDWSGRASAWEQMQELPEDLSLRASEALENMITFAVLESRKHLTQAMQDPTPVTKIQQLGRILDSLAKISETVRGARGQDKINELHRKLEERDLTEMELSALVKLFPKE